MPRAVGLIPAGAGFEDLTLNEWLQVRRPGDARYRKVLALARLPAGGGGGFETRTCYEAPRDAPASVIVGKHRDRLPLLWLQGRLDGQG